MAASDDHSGAHPGAPGRTPRRHVRRIAGALIVLYTLLVAGTAVGVGTTVDEPKYFNGGRLILRDGWTDPTTRLQGPLPLLAAQLLVPDFPDDRYEHAENARSLFVRGRLGLLPFGWLAAAVVFAWSRRLFGDAGGLLSLALFVLNPIVIGYSALTTVDMAFAACALLDLFLLWRFVMRPTTSRALAVGVGLGLALATKYLALLYAPFVALAVAVAAWRQPIVGLPRRLAAGMSVAIVTLVSLVVLHASYGFRGGLATLGGSAYRSRVVSTLVDLPGVGHALAVLPRPFLLGVDLQASIGEIDHAVYLNGRFATGHLGYYAWSFLWKTPELVLAAVLWALALAAARCFGRRAPPGWRAAAWILVPPTAGLFVYLSGFTTLQIGVRYVLPVVPAVCVASGVLAYGAGRLALARRIVVGLALVQSALAVALAWPNLIAYSNTASGGMPAAYRHFNDSNAEWGQSARRGPAAMEEAGYALLTSFGGPRLGPVAIGLVDRVCPDPEDPARRWHWLDPFEPTGTYEAAFWAYRLELADWQAVLARSSGEDAERRRAELVVALFGADRDEEAQRELARLRPERAAPLVGLRDAIVAARPADAPDVALLAAARAWGQVGRHDRAEEVLRRLADRAGPSSPVNPAFLADALVKQGRLPEAILVLEAADFERHPVAALALARYYLVAARYPQGVELLERTRHLHGGALAEPARELYEELRREHETYSRALRVMQGAGTD